MRQWTIWWSWVFGQGPKTLGVKLECWQGPAGTDGLETEGRAVSCCMAVGTGTAGMTVTQTGFLTPGSQRGRGCPGTSSLAFRVGLLGLTSWKTSCIKSSLKHPLCAGFVLQSTHLGVSQNTINVRLSGQWEISPPLRASVLGLQVCAMCLFPGESSPIPVDESAPLSDWGFSFGGLISIVPIQLSAWRNIQRLSLDKLWGPQ